MAAATCCNATTGRPTEATVLISESNKHNTKPWMNKSAIYSGNATLVHKVLSFNALSLSSSEMFAALDHVHMIATLMCLLLHLYFVLGLPNCLHSCCWNLQAANWNCSKGWRCHGQICEQKCQLVSKNWVLISTVCYVQQVYSLPQCLTHCCATACWET